MGHSCFKLKSKSGFVVYIDPFLPEKVGESLAKDVSDLLLVSHDHEDHNNKSIITGAVNRQAPFIVDREGEYEVAGVLVAALRTYHDKSEGSERGKNLIFSVIMDGLNVVHLGDLGHELSNSQIEKLGNVDVLMIPVGGFYTVNAETALKIIKDISPSYVVPMHYKTEKTKIVEIEPLSAFLDKNKFPVTAESIHKIKLDQSSLPDDTQVLLMNA